MCMLSCFSRIRLFVTPWTVALQAPLSMGFSRQEYWSGLPGSPSGVLHELTTNQKKKLSFWSVIFSYSSNSDPFLDWTVTCDKWILYDNQQWLTQWLYWEEAPKHFPKPNLHQKKVMVTVWWSATHLIYYSFLNPSKTITSKKYAQQIDEINWKLQCLQPILVNRMGLSLLHYSAWPHITQPMLQKLNELSCEVLPHLPYSPDLLPTNLSLIQASQQLFARKTLRQPAGDRKWFPRVRQIPKHGFLCYRNKPTYLSLAKICWL